MSELTDNERAIAALDWAIGEATYHAEVKASGSCLSSLFKGAKHLGGLELARAALAELAEARAALPTGLLAEAYLAIRNHAADLEAERDALRAQCEWWAKNAQVFSFLYCQWQYQEGVTCADRDCADCRAAYLASKPWEAQPPDAH